MAGSLPGRRWRWWGPDGAPPTGASSPPSTDEAIAGAGWVLVSGLARGIDGAAHAGTVTAGGAGIAVLGCGPDIHYPPEHRTLGDRLVEAGGAVVTEYPPGAAPEPWRFPLRNRIISGLSSAVVVVEAGVTGGALITAGYALAHGVPVFAVPGDVRRESSKGCNLLIRDGAHPVLDPDDLIEELSLVLGPPAEVASEAPDGPRRGPGRRRLTRTVTLSTRRSRSPGR